VDPLIEAVRALKGFLEPQGVQYMVIGGLANSVWGRPRATTDADLVVLLGSRSIAEFADLVATCFKFRIPDPIEFARRAYVLPIQVTPEVTADLSIGMLPYEQHAITRAPVRDIGGIEVRVCTAEDLVIYKAISEREVDWRDIEGILIRQGEGLDQRYILKWLRQFAQALERPDLVARYKDLQRRVQRRKPGRR
jgi:hypothetical protein